MDALPTEGSLRLLYLDWCSTRVAKRFLELSVEEVWLKSSLADSLPPTAPDTATSDPISLRALDRIPDYLELVRKTALVLAREMDLPAFAQWKQEYLSNPKLFEAELLNR